MADMWSEKLYKHVNLILCPQNGWKVPILKSERTCDLSELLGLNSTAHLHNE
jgi:hypothetical protein